MWSSPERDRPSPPRWGQLVGVALALAVLVVCLDSVAASNGLTLSKESREAVAVPQWLYLATGGAVIGASALLASFVTDRRLIESIHDWRRTANVGAQLHRPIVGLGRLLGVVMLALVVYTGYTGPGLPTASFAVLVTFAVLRAGLPMTAYLVGNPWRVLNPWRTLASVLPTGYRDYPASWARWPAVVGALVLVWLEVVLPVSTTPSVLATVAVGYSVYTLSGAVVFGPADWFDNADPLAVLFGLFGAVAPLRRSGKTLELRLPGAVLAETDVTTDSSDVAFAVVLVWELTFSGFITTTTGAAVIETLVGSLPAIVSTQALALTVYTTLFLCGYLVFLGSYWYASVISRRRTETYVTARALGLRLAAPLLAIAAGYHFAHYVGLFTSLSPALLGAVTSPLSPPANPLVLATPAWFEMVAIGAVLAGHLLAVWVAHAIAYDTFASRLVAIRSQYPFVAVMIGYTVLSLWILSLPGATPPYLA